ncbi:SdrD B-like domain-containing protein [Candidatus Chloroploca sp. Khr17]|uniref:SdrD B-like domain-containing protein n=1 Tax=Candidatus Chloroploca sp. Khr17 TaxID=2496869 RepID=UPI00101D9821|nr:SdrD B-like domain-containing protein [Candidatus Chloroploca sp. Khr17]
MRWLVGGMFPRMRYVASVMLLLSGLLLAGHADPLVRAEPLLPTATLLVTTTADSGPGSLRQAIVDANANLGLDTITFAIGTTGSQQTMQPSSSLPMITDPVTIDGWSQGGASYTGPPLIELNGALAGAQAVGLTITGGGSVVRGLVVNGFATGNFAGGIRLQTGGGNWIYGNYIGTNFAGDTRVANTRGIWIDGGSSHNRIGTNADGVNDVAERNVVSANAAQNIWIYQPATAGNLIMGNYIGLNAAGTAAVGTNNQTVAATGILVQEASYTVIGTDGDGQGDALEGNVISGSIHNINLTGTSVNMSHHNRISGNLIGTNASGTVSVGIQVEGVRVYVTENNIIGTDGDGVSDELEGNLISGNSDWGILLQQTGALNNVVAGNKIGTDITGMLSIRNGYGGSPRAGIVLGGYGNLVGSNVDGVSDDLERNLISGNANNGTSGIFSQFVSVTGAMPNTIAGNWIGVDATGLAALPNNVGISGASQGLLVRDNVIAANTFEGISLNLTTSTLTGNLIGVGTDGVTALGNGHHGISLNGSDNQIGGIGPGEANLIANNGTSAAFYNGILVNATAVRNTMRGNRIFANARLGIDLLQPAGVNVNDPDDPDTGGNNLQNYPVITFAQAYADGTTVIEGTLDSNPNTTFTLDFYYSSEADPTGYGEGEFYLGAGSATTDANGDAEFDVTLPVTLSPNQFVSATATHADGSTSEFSLAFAAGGVLDVPLEGLTLQVMPPIYEDVPAQFSASVNAGTGVSYAWDFGDGQLGSGAVVAHTFTTPGTYTVTVTATNNSSSAITSTLVSVLEPANINGVVWLDRDGDGYFGLGESAIFNSIGQGYLITATLQAPPSTVLNANIVNGSYQIFTPQAGVYLVEATNLYICSIITNCNASPSPVAVAMGEDGGTEINFGLMPISFVPQPDDDGYIVGRAWVDSNANGYPDPGETPLNGRTVRLLDVNGNQLATHVTGSSWGHGAYAFRITEPGLYRVQMDAPGGFFPASREVEVYVAGMNMLSAQLPFAAGGTIGGQVTGSGGAGLGGVPFNLQPGNRQTLSLGGAYGFAGLDNGNYTLQITPPPNYVTADGVTQRFVPATLNGSAVENWTLLKKGELTIKAVQIVNGQALPIDFLPFELLLNGSQARVVFTNAQGEALVEGLAPGTYIVQPFDDLGSLVPGLQLTPPTRTVVISNDTFASASFSGTLSRSLNMYCQLPGTFGQGFACNYEVRTLSGSLIETGYLPPSQPATSNWNLNPATLEVRLIPDPNVPGQESWPTYSQIVVIANNTHVDVRYPWNPSNPQTIAGYAFWDRCAPLGVRANSNSCTESNVPSNNDIPVTLYNQLGVAITSTLTTQGTGWNSGYFSFPNLPVPGTYRVRLNLPPGYAPTTAVERWYTLTGAAPAPELLEVGYQRNENQVLSGRVFWDTDANGVFDEAWDDPIADAALVITTPGGQAVANLTTGSNGGYTRSPITSGEYRVTLTHAGQSWTRDASVPLNGGVPLVDFPVPPEDNRPRVLVFIDGNHNGVADAGEQRLADVSVRLRDAACGSSGANLQTVNSDSGGVAVFNPPPGGFFPVCAQITAGLPVDLLPANPTGVNVPRSGGAPVALAVQPANTLLVRAFLDGNGNGSREAGEPYLSGGSATVNSVTQSLSSSGATFYLPGGSYPVQFTPPAGYASLWSVPIGPIVTNNAAQTLLIPLRDAGSVSGKIWPPGGGFYAGGGSPSAGLTVQLQNTASNAIVETSSDANGNFSFSNLAPATYRLRLPAPPPGYVADSEPLITYQSGQILSNNNLNLVPTGHVVGVVYSDNNGNGQWDGNEQSVSQYSVRLVGAGGQQIAIVAPDAAGYFRFEGLTANTPYALQLVGMPSGAFLASSPGVFTVGANPTTVQLGIGVVGAAFGPTFQVGGTVKYQQGDVLIPIAGARVVRYAYQAGGNGCNVTNPVVLADTFTDSEGLFRMQGNGHCLKVVDVPGLVDTPHYQHVCTSENPYAGQCVIVYGVWTSMAYITLSPAEPPLRAGANNTAQLAWSTFRDDNGNGYRDADEPGLAGVTLAGGGSSGVSGQTGWGQPLSLGDGLHTLTIAPPSGYVVNGPATRQIAVQGTDVELPAIPLRPAGLTLVQAFVDLDGDGEQDEREAGVGGVSVILNGSASANGVTSPDGRIQFAGLPDGGYTATAAPPPGFAGVPTRAVTLAQGGVLQLALQLTGQVSGVAYRDWDGDGHQQPDEPRVGLPLTMTLSSGTGTQLAASMGGLGLFLGTPSGTYTLAATTPTVQGQPITLAADEGQGAALAVVGPGEVRGTAWLDENRDGQRQRWESPLAGIAITLGAQTTVTDRDGRYLLGEIRPGTYTLAANLPQGLAVSLEPITISDTRGLALGLAVTPAPPGVRYRIFLPTLAAR